MYWNNLVFSMVPSRPEAEARPVPDVSSCPGGEGTEGNEGVCASTDPWYVCVVVCVSYVGAVCYVHCACLVCVMFVCIK